MAIRDKPQPPSTHEMLDKIREKLADIESEIAQSKAREVAENRLQDTLSKQRHQISSLKNQLESMSAAEIVAHLVEMSGVPLIDRSCGTYDG